MPDPETAEKLTDELIYAMERDKFLDFVKRTIELLTKKDKE
jgi:hypothetical protein